MPGGFWECPNCNGWVSTDESTPTHWGCPAHAPTAAQWKKRGADEERAAVVAWLTKRAEWLHGELMKGGTCEVEMQQAKWLAAAISRGEHRKARE